MAPKRKAGLKQPKLEETVHEPVIKVKTIGTEKTVSTSEDPTDLSLQRLSRKHGNDPAFQKRPKLESKPSGEGEGRKTDGEQGKPDFVEINRAPVLTLWVTIVAEREGYSRTSALTFGKAIAGVMANAKGRSIGVIKDRDPKDEDSASKQESNETRLGLDKSSVFGMDIRSLTIDGEPRALDTSGAGEKAVESQKVQQYLQRAFGSRLVDVERVMKELADSLSSEEIGSSAYHLYEQFRPSVVQGQQGWGKKGRLEFAQILELKT